MARSSGQGWGWIFTALGGVLLVTENSRRVELERVVELQAQRITQLENGVMKLRQSVQEKDRVIAEKDTVIAEHRAERDELVRQLSAARQTKPSKEGNV